MAPALLGFTADLSNLRSANRNPVVPRRRKAHLVSSLPTIRQAKLNI